MALSSSPTASATSRKFSFHGNPGRMLITVGAIAFSLSYRVAARSLLPRIRSGFSAAIASRFSSLTPPTVLIPCALSARYDGTPF